MTHKAVSWMLVLPMLLATTLLAACSQQGEQIASYSARGAEPVAHIVFVAGRDSHGPKAHEHRAGSELLAKALHEAHPDYDITVVYGGWPVDTSVFADVDTIVLYADGGRRHMINKHLDEFEALLDRGVGVVALHYAVEVPAESRSSALLMRAIGGYFETHWSVNPHWRAEFNELPAHPVTRNVERFSLLDEWYFNMRFQPGMNGVLPMLRAVPPAQTMERSDGPHSGNPEVRKMVAAGMPQVVAWAYRRPDGGRGFGFTGGHFHANWDNVNMRTLVLNAISWTARGR